MTWSSGVTPHFQNQNKFSIRSNRDNIDVIVLLTDDQVSVVLRGDGGPGSLQATAWGCGVSKRGKVDPHLQHGVTHTHDVLVTIK